jgi:hypothetical protein
VPGFLALKEQPGRLARPDRLESAGKLAPPGLKDPPVPPVKSVPWDRKEFRDLPDNPDYR